MAMGAYLSQPVRSKQEFAGAKAGFLSYGGSSMQACHALCPSVYIMSLTSVEDRRSHGHHLTSRTSVNEGNIGGESSRLCTLALIQRCLRAHMAWPLGHD